MIRNILCPYCSIEMQQGENLPNGRSVEHLVPNTLLTSQRSKGDGDFFACRSCNCEKGKLDEVFGLITKFQSKDPELAANALIRAFTKRENVPERYWRMYDSAKENSSGQIEARMPINGQELIEYATYFGKGLYYMKYGRIFNDKREVMHIGFYNKHVHLSHADHYQKSFSSNPVKDLESNPHSWVVAEDECVIWSKNRSHLIIFHHFISFGIEFKDYNREMLLKKKQLEKSILDNFG